MQIEQSIKIGGLTEGAVVAKPGSLPLEIAVSQVLPVNQRLWVLLNAKAGPWQPGRRPRREKAAVAVKRIALVVGLLLVAAAGVLAYLKRGRPPLPPPPTAAELQQLLERRDALQKRFAELIVANGEKSLAKAPRGGVMVGIPTSFTRSILEQVVTGLFSEMTLTLKNLKVHKEGEVRVKMVVAKKTVGKYVLDVEIHEVQGILRPGKPDVVFGRNRVSISLPVTLASGKGNADIRLQWDSKGLTANAVCGSVDVSKSVTGGVIPQDYRLAGAFKIASAGNSVTLSPDFPKELEVKILVDPSEQAWQAVDEVVKERGAGCQKTLEKVDIKEILGNLVGKGFNVKIPQKLIKPVRLPAGIKQSLDIQGLKLALEVKPTGLLVAGDRLWYGADIVLETATAAAPAAGTKKTAKP